jgi:hypothetical protein
MKKDKLKNELKRMKSWVNRQQEKAKDLERRNQRLSKKQERVAV